MSHSSKMNTCGVTISGNATGEVVVFLHSSLNSSKQWQSTVEFLQEDYKCIAIDLLGYGDAPKVTDQKNYSLEQETERVLAIIECHIGTQKFHLVGHSFGGANAIKIALEHSEKLLTLSLFEPIILHFFAKDDEQRIAIERISAQIMHSTNVDAARLFTDVWNRPGFFDSLPKAMQGVMVRDIDKVRLDFQGMIKENYLPGCCQKISVPVGLIRGIHSPEFTHQVIIMLLANISNATEFQIDCAHMGPITHAEEFNSALISVLK